MKLGDNIDVEKSIDDTLIVASAAKGIADTAAGGLLTLTVTALPAMKLVSDGIIIDLAASLLSSESITP